MADKYLKQANGVLTEMEAKQTSAGAADAGKIPALDASGKFDASLMPVGTASETDLITASENLSAGDFVNLWNSTGIKARKADASTAGKDAHGFVLAAFTSGATATIFRLSQSNTQLTGMNPGTRQFLSATTPGARTETVPTTAGQVVQFLGIAKSATELIFMPSPPITLA